MDNARIIQIVVAVLILIGFCIGVFFFFGSSKHVTKTSSAPTSPSVKGSAPYSTVPQTGTVPNSTTGPTPVK